MKTSKTSENIYRISDSEVADKQVAVVAVAAAVDVVAAEWASWAERQRCTAIRRTCGSDRPPFRRGAAPAEADCEADAAGIQICA